MKKLMICASAAIAACALNAASYIWGFCGGEYYDINGKTGDSSVYDGGKAFFYLGAVTATDSAFSFGEAKLINSASFDANNYVYGYLDTSSPLQSDSIPTAEGDQAFSLILVDRNVEDLSSYEGNYVLYNGISERRENPGSVTTYYAAFTNDSVIAQGDWKTMSSSVPEPTSGLLLLLGMAGLALKRKRA